MAKYRITGPDGQSYEVNAPDGATEDQVMAFAQKNFKMSAAPKSKPFGQQLNEVIGDVPRQLGLTARAGLQGVGGMLDLASSPIRGGLNLFGADIKPGSGQVLADGLGLPKPRAGLESAVNTAAEMVAGGALPLGVGGALAKGATGTTQAVGRVLASNPAQQLGSAGAAGLAGGYTRETGGNEGSQFAASLAAGVAAPFAMTGAVRGAQALGNSVKRAAAPSPIQVDVTINNAIKESGMSLSQLPQDVARGLRNDVVSAYKTSGNLSMDAVRRLADYRMTGLTPTAARLTLNPAQVTIQENLMKMGANSKDPALQQLAMTKNANNTKMIANLNDLGAATVDDNIAGAGKIIGGVSGYDDRATSITARLYDRAKTSDGRSAALDPQAFATKADELLTHNLRNAELPSDIRNKLNSFALGETPLTIETAEQFKTIMANVQRKSSDGGVRDAISLVRQALDDAPLLPGQPLGKGSQAAFDRARRMHRQYMGTVDKTPALQAVRDGIEPDKFVQQFVIGSGGKANVMDVAMLKNSIKADPVAMTAVKDQIAKHLKGRALGGAEDEVGKFSQSEYNKALKAIGDRKLNLFFSTQEVDQLHALGRVSSYEMVQPTGSAVGNSNTAAVAIAQFLDRVGGSSLLGKIPFGRQVIGDPMQNIATGIQIKQSLNVPRALTGGPLLQPPKRPASLMMSPAVLMGTSEEERRGY